MTGWRNSDFPEMDDEERDVPLEGAVPQIGRAHV